MFIETFLQLLPILLISTGGFFMTRSHPFDLSLLVKLIVDFFMPMLVFHSLYFSDLQGSLMVGILGSTTVIVGLLSLATYAYARIAKIDARDFMPPGIFMNSGFIGIPLMRLWGGLSAMGVIVVFDQILTIYVFTLGILIITGGLSTKSVLNMLKSPLLWAICAGFFVRIAGITLPHSVLATLEFGGDAAPPLAAFVLGGTLNNDKLTVNRHILAGVFIRLVGGFAFALLATRIFGITGVARTVLIVGSTLPSAVFTSVLPLRYGIRSQYAGPIVMLFTILGVVTIPIAFILAT
ncbi:MAG: hypothetical protein CVV46_08040 [Spirochaetae bacterium HGW-Spirochaetae-2]|jgi:hypothetical protein|nr:MAG: hypothetical protein CVV46_08040 [Spirochaetae bacterium HGW-Spirochaetae-2]